MKKKADKTSPSLDISEDVDENRQHSSAELSQVSEMCTRMLQIQKARQTLEARIEELDKENERIQGADLPALMDELGLKEFTLKSGEKVIIKPIIKASLPSEGAILKEKDIDKREELRTIFETGVNYLIKNKAGALVKHYLGAELGKDAKKLAQEGVKVLKAMGIEASVEMGVNANSLSAWVKERIQAGNPPPFEIFRVYSGSRAEVKNEKPARKSSGA